MNTNAIMDWLSIIGEALAITFFAAVVVTFFFLLPIVLVAA